MTIAETFPWCLDPPRAYGATLASGKIRSCAEDFQVFEEPVCEPDGEGEHVWLKVQKKNTNTVWVADQIARYAGVKKRLVSYAGLKDRLAVTEQWFSVHLPGQEGPDWDGLNGPEFRVMEYKRHSRKLKKGALRGNRFVIHIRELEADRDQLSLVLSDISKRGLPNYFGPQRFGHNGQNLDGALSLFTDKRKRMDRFRKGMYLSAARSLLFNRILAERVEQDNWRSGLAGDIFQLDGKRGHFLGEALDQTLVQRLDALEIHPTGPLWGKGQEHPVGLSLEIEQQMLSPLQNWQQGLEAAGVEQSRRALRVRVRDMAWTFPDSNSLVLEFALPAGSYGTTLLREILVS